LSPFTELPRGKRRTPLQMRTSYRQHRCNILAQDGQCKERVMYISGGVILLIVLLIVFL